MDGYVAKPIQENELFLAIESVIKSPAQPKDNLPGAQDATRNTNGSALLPEVGSLENDWSFQLELAQIFVEDSPDSLSEVRDAIASRNGPALMQVARCLKGSAGVFNDEKAAEAALRMELVGRDSDWKSADAVSLVLNREITRLTAELKELPAANVPRTNNGRVQLDLSAYATRLPLAI
jgi:histidine phosphotransfer protein HptB